MGRWQKDLNLSSVCDKDSLANLPDAERAAWKKVWQDLGALLQPRRQSGHEGVAGHSQSPCKSYTPITFSPARHDLRSLAAGRPRSPAIPLLSATPAASP